MTPKDSHRRGKDGRRLSASSYSSCTDGPAGMQHDQARSTASPPFPRLSKPLDRLRPSYDCVVIGSGYGGGVAAARMARAGQSVCVLERGRERWPGEYPRSDSVRQVARELHVSRGRTGKACGKATGMYHVIAGKGQSAVVCNDYQRVREVLEPEPYPDDWPTPDKTARLERQARALGLADRFRRVPQTTRFRAGRSSAGVPMEVSTLAGQDATGVNDGSKTTTLVTYLADARRRGADVFCGCEVQHVEKAPSGGGGGGGYVVWFTAHDGARARFRKGKNSGLMWVHAKKAVFLGAGALGTTEILLRSKAMGLAVSDSVGQGMSGNGDMVAFGCYPSHGANARRSPKKTFTNRPGPTITSAIDMRDKAGNPLDGYIIQDGDVPHVMSAFVKTVVCTHATLSSLSKRSIRQKMKWALSRCKKRLLHPFSPIGTTKDNIQVFLIMSHDSSQAAARLVDDELVFEFLGAGQDEERIERILAPLREAVEEDGGTLVYNPLRRLWGNHQITVHPLGGAGMSTDNSGKSGVTNHLGEVFVGPSSETHPGLIVVDGAAVPAALGVNPSATIAALAERSVAEFAERESLAISTEPNGSIDPDEFLPAHRLGPEPIQPSTQTVKEPADTISFTEALEGYLHGSRTLELRNNTSYKRAYRVASGGGEVARLLVSIQLKRTSTGDSETCYKGTMSGMLVCPTITGSPFMVHGGTVELFRPDPETCGTRKIVYDSPMTGINGRELQFHGFKILDSSVSFNPRRLWRTMTNLNVTIVEKGKMTDSGEPQTVAAGMLKIKPAKFLKQLRTITSTGQGRAERYKQALKLSSHFARQMAPHFFLPLGPLERPIPPPPVGFPNPTEPTATYRIVASDGVATKMLMWEPDRRLVRRDVFGSPLPVEDLFLIPGAAVDHRIFALPTLPTNAVTFFTRAGYRVFVVVHRIGILETTDASRWTTYDARLDIRAGLEKLRAVRGDGQKVYVVAHCMGSVALACGLLDGTVPAGWVRGLTCSQVFMHPVWSARNARKARFPVPLDQLYNALFGPWFPCRSDGGGFRQALLDQLPLRLVSGEERCASASCHRATFLFGRCWSHGNLDEATHRHVDAWFNGAGTALMGLLMRMGRRGRVAANDGRDLTTEDNVERLRGIPVMLFSGGESDVLSPEATERTYERLSGRFGLDAGTGRGRLEYRRRVVEGYGHLDCWMGRYAWRDVYPMVLDEVDRVVRADDVENGFL
ncbi:Fumarate reductase/succinate dehydrogenase flavoprotein [Cordyceps fumosorosea ARSEF 2679]|uniref:Cholesterol oxidase n=1 Tax=Cordyceps fumosorosea (strain ARSEF 2679) TaxID=1081104 RepID=A0A167Q333_CORFA|nr:Fumarate reductase/succinate dehydrogenase flavoprotein [Cordyceps fumosorosea ARSEF 2679]OAA57238.1 Fumarate reductase/succinate dehydrogenase flavoprotein [Cordyceps fumosorosea ARSEF 2679]